MSSSEDLYDNELHLAVHCSDVDATKKALDDGVNPNTIGLFGWNTLHEAASNGDLELLKLLMQYGGDCNKKDILSGFTPVHYASSEGHSECLEYLISVGGDVNIESTKGQTVPQVTRHKNCKKILAKFGITVINSVRFEKRVKRSSKIEKLSKTSSKMKQIDNGSVSKSPLSEKSVSLPEYKPFHMRSLSSSLSGEFSAKSCSSLQSLTSLGSSIDETIAGYMTLAFQYNRKTARLTISISSIILTCLKMYERHKKESFLTLQIKGNISYESNFDKKAVAMSQCFKLHTNGTEDVPAKDMSNQLETFWSSETAYLKFNPAMNIDFTSINGNDITDQNINISVLMQRKKSILKSSTQHITIAAMQLPLQDAVKRILKERYELDFGMEDTELPQIDPTLSEIIIDNGSVVSDSVIIGIRRPSVIEASRCVSDGDLKTVMSVASKPTSKKSKSTHSAINIPFSDARFGLQEVRSHSVSPIPQVQIQLSPSANSSGDELEVVVSQ